MNHSSFGRFLGFSGWISSYWLTDKLTELAGDKSDGGPENAPDEGALQEKEEAEARPLDCDGVRILWGLRIVRSWFMGIRKLLENIRDMYMIDLQN